MYGNPQMVGVRSKSPGRPRLQGSLPIACRARKGWENLMVDIWSWLVGWFDRLTAVVVVHRHNLHQQISGSAPETSLLPSPQSSGGLLEQKQEQEEGRKTKEDPKQAERATTTNELKSPTSTGYQLLAKHKSSPKHQPSATRSVEESNTREEAPLGLCTTITGNAVPLGKVRFPASPRPTSSKGQATFRHLAYKREHANSPKQW